MRVGGFGIADGILPSLGGRRDDGRDRAVRRARGARATGSSPIQRRRLFARRDPDRADDRAPAVARHARRRSCAPGDPRSDELGAFLQPLPRRSVRERFPSAVEAHRALQQMVTGNPFSLFTANLALFLYKLLNPESQSVAPSSDWESTSPVVVERKTRARTEPAGDATRPRRRHAAAPPRRPRSRRGSRAARPRSPPCRRAGACRATSRTRRRLPLAVQKHAAALIARPISRPDARGSVRPLEAPGRAASRPPAGLAAGAFLVARGPVRRRRPVRAAHRRPPPAAFAARRPAPVATVDVPPALGACDLAGGGFRAPAASRSRAVPRARRPGRFIRSCVNRPRTFGYKAALARIEADRLNARETAAELFGEGARSEKEGEPLPARAGLRRGTAGLQPRRAPLPAGPDRTWEERVRGANLGESHD